MTKHPDPNDPDRLLPPGYGPLDPQMQEAVNYARNEGLPEEKVREVLRNPWNNSSDMRRAADNYNDD
jgi:hypothetical protein